MKLLQFNNGRSRTKYVLMFLAFTLMSLQLVVVDAQELKSVEGDGWHRWTVDAVENAPSWCCYTWRNKNVQSTACNLDNQINSYGTSTNDVAGAATEIQIFTKLVDGRVEQVRAFDSSCKVNTKKRVANHGKVDALSSLAFLGKQLEGKRQLVSQSLAAISVHDSNKAQSILEASARTTQPVAKRKEAIFWMGQVRAQQSAEVLERYMLKDEVGEVREHAVFSVSQSSLRNRLALIERVARNDSSKKVRGQAWFWIAQTDDQTAGERIFAGIEDESSQAVKEQAVFALSQLKGEAGTDALIRVIETPGYKRQVRKQALFWLAQSDSDRAADYLASVLDR